MYILTFTLVFTQFIQMSSALLNITIDTFSVDCGSKDGGVMNVNFNVSDLPKGFSVYANNNPEECSFLDDGMSYVLENARRKGCAVKDPTAPYPAYYLIVFVQEDPLIQRVTDSKFLLSCVYTSGQINVSTSELAVKDTMWKIKDYHWEVIQGYIDMSYELGIYADDGAFNTPITTVNFGEKMALKIVMSGIDE
ncbi:uncharacterized protein LOC115226848, partial [Octopus sinensis]|uniref:Uncharacterized protein LOC115226848 n=1 Tax=Octopus sinensis TaxID=2607531 RepID=A0A6P7TPS5_9MOLL